MNLDVTFEESQQELEADFGAIQVVEVPSTDPGDAPSDSVRYTAQNLTPKQQAQARENIGAASVDDIPKIPETAEVGQTIVVKAVDENGKPTEWEAADLPSGGGGAEWKLVANVTLEEDVGQVSINTNLDGKTFAEAGYSELFIRYNLLGHGSGNYSSRYSNLQIWFNNAWHGGANAGFTNLGNGYDDVAGSVHAIYPKELESTGIGRVGHARHSSGVLSYFQTYGVLASVNIKTIAGLKAGSQIIIYGR